MPIKHAFTSAKSDGGDTTLVRPSNWNADHTADGAIDLGSATSLIIPTASAPTPTADGSLAYGTTQKRYAFGGNGLTGYPPRVLSVTRPNEQLTNSTASLQDFASIFTIPANFLIAQKVLRISAFFQYVTDSGASGQAYNLKLGSTTVYSNASITPGNSQTRSFFLQWLVFGTAAAGASVNVDTSLLIFPLVSSAIALNNTAQPVALATNGALNIVPGITFTTSSGGESLTLLNAMVEELN